MTGPAGATVVRSGEIRGAGGLPPSREQVARSEQRAAGDEEAGGEDGRGRATDADGYQQQGREQRRGVGRGTERADVAVLRAVVPEEEGRAARAETDRTSAV